MPNTIHIYSYCMCLLLFYYTYYVYSLVGQRSRFGGPGLLRVSLLPPITVNPPNSAALKKRRYLLENGGKGSQTPKKNHIRELKISDSIGEEAVTGGAVSVIDRDMISDLTGTGTEIINLPGPGPGPIISILPGPGPTIQFYRDRERDQDDQDMTGMTGNPGKNPGKLE